MKHFLLSAAVSMLLAACGGVSSAPSVSEPETPVSLATLQEPSAEFRTYWFNGQAELNRFELKQGRYADVHPGDAVLIFVSEDMHREKHIKAASDSDPKVAGLLCNFSRKFWTGVYPYSQLTSTFSPVDGSPLLRVSSSSEEWCGHTFMLADQRKNKYEVQLHSYFPGEGDETFMLDACTYEDELFTRIRLNPSSLPTGDLKMVPAFTYLRMLHKDVKCYSATAEVLDAADPTGKNLPAKLYKITYPQLNREVTITYENQFPWQILAFSDKAPSFNGSILETSAVRTHSLRLDYWSHNSLSDSTWRKQLGL